MFAAPPKTMAAVVPPIVPVLMIVAESVAAMPYFPSTAPLLTMTVEPAVPVATAEAVEGRDRAPRRIHDDTARGEEQARRSTLAVLKPTMPPRLMTVAVARSDDDTVAPEDEGARRTVDDRAAVLSGNARRRTVPRRRR